MVEDYEPFRRFLCSTLSREPGFEICEAADGLEAVKKAEEFRPELILLDIGLPSLNGIGAARRIHKLSPESKILFVSQESSAEVVYEALASGALGYVVKVHAGTELLPAVDAVLEGRQFVSSGLSGHHFTSSSDLKTVDTSDEPPQPTAAEKMKVTRHHQVEFYSDETGFVVGFTHFIESALAAGTSVISVVTESHQESLLQRLREHGVDIVAAIKQGRYISLDVAGMLSTFMVNDLPDPARFLRVASDQIAAAERASTGNPRVALCGECAPVLWEQGKTDAAMEVEHLCEEIARSCDADILCGYVLSAFQSDQENRLYERIRAKHSADSSF